MRHEATHASAAAAAQNGARIALLHTLHRTAAEGSVQAPARA